MIVKCTLKELNYEMSKNVSDYFKSWNILPLSLPIHFNQEYIVYALEFTVKGFQRVYILSDSDYPKSYPIDFFEIIDFRLSKFWKCLESYQIITNKKSYPHIYSFQEWSLNEYFHGEMFENKGNSKKIFKYYKERMDLEFKRNGLPEAFKIDENLYLCYYCEYANEDKSELEVLKCPKCGLLQNK